MSNLVERNILTYEAVADGRRQRLPWRYYSVEGLASAGTNLLISAIYFYTADRFHWGLKQNFLLATGQGVFYILGALTADKVVSRFERRLALAAVYCGMALLPLLAFYFATKPAAVAILLLAYSYVSSVGWPIVESLVATSGDHESLSRRMSIYNVVWSSFSVVMLAIDGTLIVHWPSGVFLLPVFAHAVSAGLMLAGAGEDAETRGHGDTWKEENSAVRAEYDPATTSAAFPFSASPRPRVSASSPASPRLPVPATSSPPAPEPELLRVRTLALWLSRGVLPATYVVVFSLMALMPSLPVMHPVREEWRTPIASIWMVTRLLAFLLLGLGTWWHTRPRILLVAAVVTLIAFFGTTVRPSDFLTHGSPIFDLFVMIVAQLALGAALGMIYAASLYFGMVLSDGSTEHGGYHEALIGTGFVLGPGAGALAQVAYPTNGIHAAIVAVGGVVTVSVIAVAALSMIAARKAHDDVR